MKWLHRAQKSPLKFVTTALIAAFALTAIHTPIARAMETDQFTLPPQELDDIGRDMNDKIVGVINDVITQVNANIDAPGTYDVDDDADDSNADGNPEAERYIVKQIYNRTGGGFLVPPIERFSIENDFPSKRNARYKPDIQDSIYIWVYSFVPFSFFFDSPTIRMYGINFGTDKIGHFFQQGWEYYDRYKDALADRKSEELAVQTAVDYGVMTENTYYGILIDGVYSNGDLAANYAGFKFYRNILNPVKVGDRTIPPILTHDKAGHWMWNANRENDQILEPFFSEHLNEAFNPCHYVLSIDIIRGHVRDRCEQWKKTFPDFNQTTEEARWRRVQTWFGEPYGHKLTTDNAVTFLTECFGVPRDHLYPTAPINPAN